MVASVASVAFAFWTWVWCSYGVIPDTFTADGAERITVEGLGQALSSVPLATCLSQTKSLEAGKGKLVVGPEVGWVSQMVQCRALMEEWRAGLC